jgi:hypothetical protein
MTLPKTSLSIMGTICPLGVKYDEGGMLYAITHNNQA